MLRVARLVCLICVSWTPTAALAQSTFEDASERLAAVRVDATAGGSGYSGVAIVDFDLDGDLDLYFANGPGQGNVLLANDGTGHFIDVSVPANVRIMSGSRAVVALDYDNDGCPDLIAGGDLTDPLGVMHSNCDGTFDDTTEQTGIRGATRNNSVHAADVNGDGWVDVFLTGGVIPSKNHPNTLYLNNGDGTFDEVSAAAGVDTAQGGCAATFTHLDDDDDIDLLVANCATPQADTPFEVFVNDGAGSFEDRIESSKVWEIGRWMGLAILDLDADGHLDFFATNSGLLRDEPHVLYRNNGDGTWTEQAEAARVAQHEFGWGAVAADLDNDGWVDLYYTGKSQTGDFCASPGVVFHNQGDGTFADPVVPVDLTERWTSGVAAGDLDGNGYVDLVVVTTAMPSEGLDGSPVLLLNQGGDNHWLNLRLRGTAGDPMAIGARVYVTTPEGPLNLREIHAGTSYLSSNSPWPTVGLGTATEAEVCVRWPDGSIEGFGTWPADSIVELTQGEGTPVDACAQEATTPTTTPTIDTADTGEPPDGERPVDPPETAEPGCGCASGPAPAALLLGWVGALFTRRRATP